MQNCLHLEEVDAPWAIEIITEKFDGLLELLTDDCYIYGGAVRDVLAGLSLEGDLDIMTARPDFDIVIHNINSSAKWIHCGNLDQSTGKYPTNRPIILSARKPSKTSAPIPNRKGNVNYSIDRVENFKNLYGEKIQVMLSVSAGAVAKDNALAAIRRVDLTCCGIAMDRFGRVYEVVEGAHEACKSKTLLIGIDLKSIEFDRTKERIDKLVSRGWKNKINLKSLKRSVNKLNKTKKATTKTSPRKKKENLKEQQYSLDDNDKTKALFSEIITVPLPIEVALDSQTLPIEVDLNNRTLNHKGGIASTGRFEWKHIAVNNNPKPVIQEKHKQRTNKVNKQIEEKIKKQTELYNHHHDLQEAQVEKKNNPF